MATKEAIVPFRCATCGREFVGMKGGICSVCRRPFCRVHLAPLVTPPHCWGCRAKTAER